MFKMDLMLGKKVNYQIIIKSTTNLFFPKFLSVLYVSLFILSLCFTCKPVALNNPSDPSSKAYFETAVLLCALGKAPCNSCSPPPGPWDSFIGEVTSSGSYTSGLSFRVDQSYNLYGLAFSSNQFGSGGIGFQGAVGSTTNFLLTKFSASGQRVWISYLGQRSDRPNGVRYKENDGVYVYGATSTISLPSPVVPHSGTGSNSFITKLNVNNEFSWTRYFNDGTNSDSAIVSDMIEATDSTGFYIVGFSTGAIVSPGSVIGTNTGNDWYIQKISYSGIAIFTKYIPFVPSVANSRPLRIVEIPNGQGFYIVALNSEDINSEYPNGKNSFPGYIGNIVMKLDSEFNYQWHRYLGGTNDVVDDIAPSVVAFSNQNILTSAMYSDSAPSTGQLHPGTGIDSTIFYRLDGSGNLLNSSFVYNPGESVIISDSIVLSNGKVLISGSVGSQTGITSEFDPISLREDYRISGKENFKAASVQHCDGSFSSYGSSNRVIAESPIPYGNGATNAIFSRFIR
ncbi:hypothetical protein EHQ16_19000 [Leptospira kanakyensis]|uniref:Uncharacterized protein n=1 Tax=Leptospira kanakyensis TaxID=2484968 RepID=A0A6N4QIB3_9LEPT|nr:hypothetical protein [Leptospira kanakyensis]TGK54111.1 hypothetical protein EHQ11_07310 [Leptospira kanakyensis]TGK57906.1 hypothetical protein EHQ16_19000 [Leptospira kanakyensis]TGK73613.1 hypothetical protein EHQ18_07385 [Leptospira kanakyensis]